MQTNTPISLALLDAILGEYDEKLTNLAVKVGQASALTSFIRGIPHFLAKHLDPGVPTEILQQVGLSQSDLFHVESGDERLARTVGLMSDAAVQNLKQADALWRECQVTYFASKFYPVFMPTIDISRFHKTLQKAAYNPFDPRLRRTDGWLAVRMAWRKRFNESIL